MKLTKIGPGLGSRKKVWTRVLDKLIVFSSDEQKFISVLSVIQAVEKLATGNSWDDIIPFDWVDINAALFDEIEALDINSSDVYSIEKDINRTFGLFMRQARILRLNFPSDMSSYCEALKLVLIGASRERGYCQGLNFIAASLLLHLADPKLSFVCLSYILKKQYLEILFESKYSCLFDYMKMFEMKLRKHNLKLFQHFQKYDFNASSYALEWFTTCFVVSIPGDLSSCVLDLIISGIPNIMIKVGLALLDHFQQELLQLDFEGLYSKFKPLLLQADPVIIMFEALIMDIGCDFDILREMRIEIDLLDPSSEGNLQFTRRLHRLRKLPRVESGLDKSDNSDSDLYNNNESDDNNINSLDDQDHDEASVKIRHYEEVSSQQLANLKPKKSSKSIPRRIKKNINKKWKKFKRVIKNQGNIAYRFLQVPCGAEAIDFQPVPPSPSSIHEPTLVVGSRLGWFSNLLNESIPPSLSLPTFNVQLNSNPLIQPQGVSSLFNKYNLSPNSLALERSPNPLVSSSSTGHQIRSFSSSDLSETGSSKLKDPTNETIQSPQQSELFSPRPHKYPPIEGIRASFNPKWSLVSRSPPPLMPTPEESIPVLEEMGFDADSEEDVVAYVENDHKSLAKNYDVVYMMVNETVDIGGELLQEDDLGNPIHEYYQENCQIAKVMDSGLKENWFCCFPYQKVIPANNIRIRMTFRVKKTSKTNKILFKYKKGYKVLPRCFESRP